MKNTTTRLPKKDYFMMRYNEAMENGLSSKANYYRGRLEQMGVIFSVDRKEEELNELILEWEENIRRIRRNKNLSLKQKVEQLHDESKSMLSGVNIFLDSPYHDR